MPTADLEVQVGPGGVPALSDQGDAIAGPDRSSLRDQQDGVVRVRSQQIARVLLHGGGSVAHLGFTVPAQVGQDEPIARREHLGNREPEFMMDRTGMQKNYSRAVANGPIDDLGIATSYALCGRRRHAQGDC